MGADERIFDGKFVKMSEKMISDFCIQFKILPKIPMTWGELNEKVLEVKGWLVKNGLFEDDFHITDDPTFQKSLRIDLGLSKNLVIDQDKILTFLRNHFEDLYFIE